MCLSYFAVSFIELYIFLKLRHCRFHLIWFLLSIQVFFNYQFVIFLFIKFSEKSIKMHDSVKLFVVAAVSVKWALQLPDSCSVHCELEMDKFNQAEHNEWTYVLVPSGGGKPFLTIFFFFFFLAQNKLRKCWSYLTWVPWHRSLTAILNY